jgi:hypothetical protein
MVAQPNDYGEEGRRRKRLELNAIIARYPALPAKPP